MRTVVPAVARCVAILACAAALAPATANAAAPPCANLSISHFAVEPSSLLAGHTATVTIEVKNTGTCAAPAFIAQFKLSQFKSPAVAESTSPPLNAGSSETLTLPYDFTKAGDFRTEAVIDPAHEVIQSSYLKDIAIHAVTVIAPTVSFRIKSISVTSADPTSAVVVDRPAVAVVVLENTGNVEASPFYVQWTPYTFAKSVTQPLPGGLEPGHQESITLEYTYTSKGSVSATFAVNASGRLTPFTSATREYTVEAALPNLRISHLTTNAALAGSPSTVELTVENNGNAGAGSFEIEWSPAKGQPAQTLQVDELPEGAVVPVTFTNVFATAGTYEGTVTLDPTHAIKELFATEKTAKTKFVIAQSTVDLTVTKLVVSGPVIQSRPTEITVGVKNLGNTESPTFVTAWNPSSSGVSASGPQTIAKDVPPLGPGEETNVVFHFTYAKPGLYRSVAEVNFGRGITESDYENNIMLAEVQVEPVAVKLEFTPAPPKSMEFFVEPVPPTRTKVSSFWVNEKGKAALTVINNGPIATGPFEVQFQQETATSKIAGSKEGYRQAKFLPGLNPDEEREVTFNVGYGKAGKYLAKAIIDPADHINKTIPEDYATQEITVKAKSARLGVGVEKLKIIWRPGNYPLETTNYEEGHLKIENITQANVHFEKWSAFLFVYDQGAKCKLKVSTLAKEEITKTLADLAPEEHGYCPKEEWEDNNEQEERSTPKLKVSLELHEEEPLYAAALTAAKFEHVVKAKYKVCFIFCKTVTLKEVGILEPAFPGQAILPEQRAEYFKLGASPTVVSKKGTGCKDNSGNEEPDEEEGPGKGPPGSPPPGFEQSGDCFSASFRLTGESIVGPAVRARDAAAGDGTGLRSDDVETGEGEEGESGEQEVSEEEALEQAEIEAELAAEEAQAVRTAEREAAEAEAHERTAAAAAIQEGVNQVEAANQRLEAEDKAAIKAIKEEAARMEAEEEGDASSKRARRAAR